MREPRREEDHVEPGSQAPREHVSNLKADICRLHAVTSDRHHLGRRIDSRHRVSPHRQRLRPQASPTCNLQHASDRPHLRDQPRDMCTSRRNVVAVGRHVVLGRPATVVGNLISQHLVDHPSIITQRCDRLRTTKRVGCDRIGRRGAGSCAPRPRRCWRASSSVWAARRPCAACRWSSPRGGHPLWACRRRHRAPKWRGGGAAAAEPADGPGGPRWPVPVLGLGPGQR